MSTTLNPSDCSASLTLSGGNLVATVNAGPTGNYGVRSVATLGSGKYYFEWTVNADSGAGGYGFGVANATASLAAGVGTNTNGIALYRGGFIQYNNTQVVTGLGTMANGDVICVAVDTVNGKFWARRNANNWNNSGTDDPATNTGGYGTLPTGTLYVIAAWSTAAQQGTLNTGGSAYAQTKPSGFTDVNPTTAYTLTAATGSFTETGVAATLRVGHVLPAAVGSFALTGVAAGLKRGYALVASVGTFAETGVAASLRTARVITAAKGTFTFTGIAANLAYGTSNRLVASTGSFSLTGQTANFIYVRRIAFPVTAGAYAITGINATLQLATADGWTRLPVTAETWTPAGTTAETWAPVPANSETWSAA